MENPSTPPESASTVVADLEAKLTAEESAHRDTKAALASAQAALTERETALSEASTIIDGQSATIKEQADELDRLQASPSAFPTITVDKKVYEVQAPKFQHGKRTYTAAELLKDKTLQKELVKKGVGFLVEKEA